jgi:predicted transcriptional regulator
LATWDNRREVVAEIQGISGGLIPFCFYEPIGILDMPALNEESREILRALAGDHWLKSHRYLDGTKLFRLHGLDVHSREVSRQVVDALLSAGLISSNQKFPAATFTLTDEGHELALSIDSPTSGE